MARHIQPKLSLVLSEGLLTVQRDEFIRPVHAYQTNMDAKSGDFYNTSLPTVCRWTTHNNPFLLSRGTVGREKNTYISTWHVKQTYKIKVVSASNCNVSESMKVQSAVALK